jgi:hypothetical protein
VPHVVKVATLQHCLELAPRLRTHDLLEIQAVRPGVKPVDILLECVKVTHKSFAVIHEGVGCIAIFGVRSMGNQGVPWMLASDHLFQNYSREFVRGCKGYVAELVKDYDRCYNYVAVVNTKAHTWLKWLGFEVHKQFVTTVNGVDFHPFTYTRNTNV